MLLLRARGEHARVICTRARTYTRAGAREESIFVTFYATSTGLIACRSRVKSASRQRGVWTARVVGPAASTCCFFRVPMAERNGAYTVVTVRGVTTSECLQAQSPTRFPMRQGSINPTH